MTELLRKLGLTKIVTFELPVNKLTFLNNLQQNIDPPGNSFFAIFSRSKNLYKGTVNEDGFELKRKPAYFQNNLNFVKASGRVTQFGDKVIVETEINSFSYVMIPIIIFLMFVYTIFIVSLFMNGASGDMAAFTVPFLFVHAAFMFGVPYYTMRRALKVFEYDFERDVFFMMKEKVNR